MYTGSKYGIQLGSAPTLPCEIIFESTLLSMLRPEDATSQTQPKQQAKTSSPSSTAKQPVSMRRDYTIEGHQGKNTGNRVATRVAVQATAGTEKLNDIITDEMQPYTSCRLACMRAPSYCQATAR